MRGNGQEAGDFAALLLEGLQSGSVEVPYWLLQYYPQLRLGEHEVMLLIHLMAFKQKEGKDFPTPEELCARMSIAQDKVITVLQKLMREGFLLIDETKDPVTGVHSEAYNWSPLLNRLAAIRADEWEAARRAQIVSESARGERKDIFSIFEKEFGRPLTPMEFESITGWLDKDGHPEALILAGLKEAVFAGKVHFRYIDRILLEWQRNRITSVEQAKEHSQKFRSR
ncbi:DnaD domain protein [Paenibacillus validus]|uniref:DnaD domain protein n=1 Tax=Paenibacillus validus TaxID=44253 RepID=A0A7X2ZCW7_9BACL|nr:MULTISPECIES: DnaD domain protein [Paenibacillus]MED4602514.1 DnaD domain protein [Paenibacillus validus]MED4609141.1 DnaD domain protein [Paenibacillus validus]MUG72645.1 DnaD domain protein [Paenibacillus validus]